MARPKSGGSAQLSESERRTLQRVVRTARGTHAAQRATVLLLSSEGQSAGGIARALGISLRTVHRVRRRWQERGLEALEDGARPGRPPRLSCPQLAFLLRTAEADPHSLGFAFASWTLPRLSAFLQQRTGVSLSAWSVGEVLRCHGYVWRRAQLTTRHLPDEEEKSARLQALAEAAAAGERARGTLRALVRGGGSLRLAARGALAVAPPRPPGAPADAGQECARGRGGRHPLPHPPIPLHPPAQAGDGRPGATAHRPAGGARQAHGATHRARPRQRPALLGPPRPDGP
jgi:transposase